MIRLRFQHLFAFSLAVLLLALTACSRNEFIQSESTYTFTNTLNEKVTLDLYGNRDDYNKGSNVIKTLQIPAGAAESLVLEALDSFWVDWYTSDYSINNWPKDSIGTNEYRAFPAPELSVAVEDVNVAIGSRSMDISRSVLLNGNELSSTWRVDVEGNPALNGTHLFTFGRGYAGQYTYTPKTGAATVTPIRFWLFQLNALGFRMKVRNDDGVQLAEIYYNGNPNSYPNFGRDTLMVNFRTVNYYSYYPARRQ